MGSAEVELSLALVDSSTYGGGTQPKLGRGSYAANRSQRNGLERNSGQATFAASKPSYFYRVAIERRLEAKGE
jgi:hypothetical protein